MKPSENEKIREELEPNSGIDAKKVCSIHFFLWTQQYDSSWVHICASCNFVDGFETAPNKPSAGLPDQKEPRCCDIHKSWCGKDNLIHEETGNKYCCSNCPNKPKEVETESKEEFKPKDFGKVTINLNELEYGYSHSSYIKGALEVIREFGVPVKEPEPCEHAWTYHLINCFWYCKKCFTIAPNYDPLKSIQSSLISMGEIKLKPSLKKIEKLKLMIMKQVSITTVDMVIQEKINELVTEYNKLVEKLNEY